MRGSKNTGFSLIELLVVIMLLGVIARIAAPFTIRVVKSMQAARLQSTTNARCDNAINQLRSDIWQAGNLRVVSGHQLLITGLHHDEIRWQCDDDQHLRRSVPNRLSSDFGAMPAPIRFTDARGTVQVTIASNPIGSAGNYVMPCPVRLLAEDKP